jgi:hypothetical protein
MTISIAMAMQWYGMGRIARWIISGDSLNYVLSQMKETRCIDELSRGSVWGMKFSQTTSC